MRVGVCCLCIYGILIFPPCIMFIGEAGVCVNEVAGESHKF